MRSCHCSVERWQLVEIVIYVEVGSRELVQRTKKDVLMVGGMCEIYTSLETHAIAIIAI